MSHCMNGRTNKMIQGTKVVILNPPDIEKSLQRVITELNDSGKRVISISSIIYCGFMYTIMWEQE